MARHETRFDEYSFRRGDGDATKALRSPWCDEAPRPSDAVYLLRLRVVATVLVTRLVFVLIFFGAASLLARLAAAGTADS